MEIQENFTFCESCSVDRLRKCLNVMCFIEQNLETILEGDMICDMRDLTINIFAAAAIF